MKTISLKMALLGYLLSAALVSCTHSLEQKKAGEERNDSSQVVSRDTEQDRLDLVNNHLNYKEEAEARLRKNDIRIAELKEKTKNEKKRLRTEQEKQLEELKQLNAQLREHMEQYKVDSNDKLELFKKQFNQQLDEIAESIASVADKSTQKKKK